MPYDDPRELQRIQKKALARADRQSRVLQRLENDPRNLKHESGLCHGYLVLDCDTCMKALAERLQQFQK